MGKFSLEKQTYEVPGSRSPGQTGIYRNAQRPVVEESFSPKVKSMIDVFNNGNTHE
jgi:long-chain acyl-CoA synthetase